MPRRSRRIRPPRLLIPSIGVGAPRRRLRLLALLACRNEMRFLPGYVENLAPHVEGIVALDDGSTDGSAEFLEARDEVVEVLRVPPRRERWDEPGNYRRLVEAALARRPDWLLSLDADERVERDFRARAERVIRRGGALGFSAYSVRLFELWDSPREHRVDGIWGGRGRARLFQARPDHSFDGRALHGLKIPLQAPRLLGRYPLADLNVYHLRMIRPEDRLARRRRYEELDRDARWQPHAGYAYLTDEAGIRLARVPENRAYAE